MNEIKKHVTNLLILLSVRKKKHIFFILFFSVIFYYGRSLFAFFQGDEWVYFSYFLPFTKQWNGIFLAFYKSIADANSVSSGAHLTPLYNVFWFLNNQFFGLHYIPYILVSIIVHAINSFLIYIFTNDLLKKRNIAFLSSLFFALSYNHQQSVTWIMAYIPTSISVTFLLLCLIFVKQAISYEDQVLALKKIKFAFFFFLMALLTKETTSILFFILPLMVILYKKEIFKKLFLKYYFFLLFFYLLYRVGIPKLFSLMDPVKEIASNSQTNLGLSLIIIRIFIYPLKVISQVYVPAGLVLSWVESITPLAYPQYAGDKGANFVTFTQGPGSDMVFYLIGIVFIVSVLYFVYWKFNLKQYNHAKAILLSFSIVIFSSYPLILIALYAPWWGYATFIDSRHLYIASVGASILFAFFLLEVSGWISKGILGFSRIKIEQKKVLIVLILIWSITQFLLLQKDLDQQILTGKQRKTVLSAILKTVPADSPKKIILVESDTAYYTFYAIPPFQTNLGQALMVYYYQLGKLPTSFIKVGGNILTKGDIKAQGIISYEGKTFGYFIDKNTVFEKVVNKEFTINEFYAFHWKGETNTIEDQTNKVRSEIKQVIELREKRREWKEYKDSLTGVAFMYPPSMVFSEEVINSSSVSKILYLKKAPFSVRVEILRVPEGLGFYDVMTTYKDSDGNNVKGIVVKTFAFDPIHRNTALMADSGSRPKYFIPTHHEVVSFSIEEKDDKGEKLLEQIMGSITYKKDQ